MDMPQAHSKGSEAAPNGAAASCPLIPAKTIVTRQKAAGWFGCEYNMNIYRGCNHGCIYCDSRSDCYQNPDFATVKAKENAIEIIRKELAAKRKAGVIATGSMSDPYNPHERGMQLTRQALGLVRTFECGVAIATKSDLAVRDIDLLQDISRRAPVLVKITITVADDALAAKIEPGAPPPSARLEAIRRLSAAGIYTGVLMMPVLPYLADSQENILQIAGQAAAAGARFVYPGLGVTQRAGQREYFHNALEHISPGMAEKYRKSFGGDYMCPAQGADRLYKALAARCRQLGLLYKMADIISDYKVWPQAQMSLFDE